MKSYFIIHIKHTNIARAPNKLLEAFQKYSDISVSLIDINHYNRYHIKNFSIEEFIKRKINELKNTENKHCILHFHNILKPEVLREIKKNLKCKSIKKIIQYHSEPERVTKNTRVDKRLVLNQYHMTLPLYENDIPVYNIVDYNKKIFDITENKASKEVIRIGYTPSVLKRMSKYFDKGYIETRPILFELRNKYNIEIDIMHGMAYEKCMMRKQECHILIDECKTGSFHQSGLEGLALGKVTICYIKHKLKVKLQKKFNINMPFISANIDNLYNTLRDLITKKSIMELNEIGKRNRVWFEQHWNVNKIINNYITIYDDTVGLPKPKIKENKEINKTKSEVKIDKKQSDPIVMNKVKSQDKDKKEENININTYFDKIFIINMKKRKDRWDSITKQLKEYNITNYERVEAIIPRRNQIPKNHYNQLLHPKRRQTDKYIIGSMGCKKSHHSIIITAKKRNYKKILILEDDAQIKKDFNKIFENSVKIINEKKYDWKLLYLGGSYLNIERLEDRLAKTVKTKTTHAYAIHHSVFNTIISNCLTSGTEIDSYYTRLQKQVDCFCIIPSIIGQISSFSDILQRDVNYSI